MSKSVYEIVTERIVNEMSKGVVPWSKPWVGGRGPFNRVSKKSYSLLNQMLLPYPGEYASLKQWDALGGTVKAGEKAHYVTFWKWLEKVEGQDADGQDIIKRIPCLRYYTVFHISQVEGVEPLSDDEIKDIQRDVDAEAVKDNYFNREKCTLLETVSHRAFYRPSTDEVVMPMAGQFKTAEDYYATLFHEMTHSTGHQDRLNRLTQDASFGDEVYSKEELVAEIGSSMLLTLAGLDWTMTIKNTAAYLQSWLKVLKNDPRMIVSASSKAEKAVGYILNGKA